MARPCCRSCVVFCTRRRCSAPSFFFFNDTATTEIYTLSLHDALPIFTMSCHSRETVACPTVALAAVRLGSTARCAGFRSEEHTSELQSQSNLVCRLLLEKKKPGLHTLLLLARTMNPNSYLTAYRIALS